MAWVAVDYNGVEGIYDSKPDRIVIIALFIKTLTAILLAIQENVMEEKRELM